MAGRKDKDVKRDGTERRDVGKKQKGRLDGSTRNYSLKSD